MKNPTFLYNLAIKTNSGWNITDFAWNNTNVERL